MSSHPGCRSLRSLALGLVLLPRWGVSLRLCVSPKSLRTNHLLYFIPNGKRSERPSSSQPRAIEHMWATPWMPIPEDVAPWKGKSPKPHSPSYRFCPFRAPSGVSFHPGCSSLQSLALGLVLLPRWGVSLQIMVRCAHTTLCSVFSRKDAKGRKEKENVERWTLNDESSEEMTRSEVLKFWGERWTIKDES